MNIKIIASLVKGEQYRLAQNAARAPYFIVFHDDKFVKSIKNPFIVGGGAGFAVAELLKAEGCTIFIAKEIGIHLQKKLDEYGITTHLIQ